ncbi:hypothetical protein [Marimonas lutisalis]|uniref:hypothetical protein n=1 Tax=Marimonas lutisalis TaxID=2545756 RepID=UPI0010F8EEB4|nr:hypothetical protein [Marimonas lutisalis]
MTVISLTSIPPRFSGLGPVLESLLAQGAERVVLALPRAYARFPGPVSPPPVPGGVEILWCDDQGPATKLLAAQAACPGADIVYCDDDCVYGPGWLAALGAGAAPGVAAAGAVFDVARLKRRGGLVAQGFAGVLIPAGLRFAPPPAACRAADDLWLSAQMALAGLKIRPCPEARAKVTPFAAPAPLQDENRADHYARAAEHIQMETGLWPEMPG